MGSKKNGKRHVYLSLHVELAERELLWPMMNHIFLIIMTTRYRLRVSLMVFIFTAMMMMLSLLIKILKGTLTVYTMKKTFWNAGFKLVIVWEDEVNVNVNLMMKTT